MPVNVVQQLSGKFNGVAQASTALATATTAGNVVVIVASSSGTLSAPTGGGTWVRAAPTSAVNNLGIWIKPTTGGETSWTVGPGASAVCRYDIFELEGADFDFPVDVAPSGVSTTGSSDPVTTGIPRSTTYDGLFLAAHSVNETIVATTHSFSGQDNGVTELTDDSQAGASSSVSLACSARTVQSLAIWASTATRTPDSGNWRSTGVVITAAGAKREPDIKYFWGFSSVLSGYPASHSVSPANSRYWDSQLGSPTIDSNGLRLVSTADIQGIATSSLASITNQDKALLQRIRFRLNGAPSTDTQITYHTTGDASFPVYIRYRTASQKLGVQIGSGTEQLSSVTIPVDTWIDLETRFIGTTVNYRVDWRLNVGSGWQDQTQATATAGAAFAVGVANLGQLNGVAATADLSFRYAAYSVNAGHYPLGDYSVQFLGPDPAGTPTVVTGGTASSFRRFTANGTIDGAFSATAIRDALDDWPPVFGASADGLAIVTADAFGLNIPMDTYNAVTSGGSVRAARVIAPIWAASATAATIMLRGHWGSGTTDYNNLYVMADPNADTSSTPPWIAVMWRPANGWTQSKLDFAYINVQSDDATPDIGPHAIGMEVLVKLGATQRVAEVTGLEGVTAPATVDAVLDADSGGVISYTASAPPDFDAVVSYVVRGSPVNVTVPAGSSDLEVIDAADASEVTSVTIGAA